MSATTSSGPGQSWTDGLQYLRRAQLVVGVSKSDALDLSQLRVKFNIVAGTVPTPKTLTVRVYNVSDATSQRVQLEGAPIRLAVGYGLTGPLTAIFNGNVTFIRRGRESSVDTYLDLTAADGDAAHVAAVVNKTFAAGYTHSDVVDAACTAMNPFGVTKGTVQGLPTISYPRGRAIYAPARAVMRDVTRSTGTTSFVEDGSLNVIPAQGYPIGVAVQINNATGMIGIPQQTPEGIAVRCLLNPRIRPGGQIQINNKDIARMAVGTSPADVAQAGLLPRVTEDGFYQVLLVQHSGDTRDNAWYSDIICVAVGDNPTASFAARQYLPDGRTPSTGGANS